MVTREELLSAGRTCLCVGKHKRAPGQRGPSQIDQAGSRSAGLGWTPCVQVSWALDGSHAWWLSDLHPKVNEGPFLLSAQTLPTFPTGSSPVSRSQPAASANRQLEWWGKGARDSGVRCQQLPR